MKRLFLAIPFLPSKALIQWKENLKKQLHYEAISWVKHENLHLTLKFLGETAEAKVPEIKEAVQISLVNKSMFSFQIDKFGIFGSTYQPRVIWLGSSKENEQMTELGESVLNGLAAIGFARDSQNFVPHLSLARIRNLKDKQLFRKIIAETPPPPLQVLQIENLCLYESILQKEGPLYRVEQAFQLSKL